MDAALTTSPERPLLLRVAEVAELLQVSRASAYRMAERGELPVVRLPVGLRVNRRQLEAWIDQQTTGPAVQRTSRPPVAGDEPSTDPVPLGPRLARLTPETAPSGARNGAAATVRR